MIGRTNTVRAAASGGYGVPSADARGADPRRRESRSVLRRLRDAGLEPRRRLGQHFLLDGARLRALVDAAAVGSGDTVLEVGTGPGTLTRCLCERAARVYTVEVDHQMAAFARHELAGVDHLEIIETDILSSKGTVATEVLERLRSYPQWKLVANLPYAVATPLILELFAGPTPPAMAVVTVQREVADRLAAAPGSRPYGAATAQLAYWAAVEPLWTLPAGAFTPAPKVASRVVRIVRRAEPLGSPAEFQAFATWVRRLFAQRRKQIGGLLRRELGTERSVEAVQSLAVRPDARPEELEPAAFLALARRFRSSGEGRARGEPTPTAPRKTF